MPGSIWRLASGETEGHIHSGDQTGFDAAKAVLAGAPGLLQVGPGLEALVIGAGWANISLVRITNTGVLAISRLHIADGTDPTKLFRFDASAIGAGLTRVGALPNWDGVFPLPADLGISGQFLKSNGAGVQSTWAAVSIVNALLDGANHSDTVAQAVLRGALVVGNSTPAWSRLSIGAASTLLKSDGTDPSWGTVSLLSAFHGDTLADSVARGDLVIGNATPKWSRLAKGAADTFLGSDGTDLSWRSIAAIAALVSHDLLAHIKAVRATGCGVVNGTATLTTSGGQFANVRVGDRVNFDSSTTSLWGASVSALINSNSVTLDRTNTGSTVSGAVCVITPGDHYNSALTESNGYFIAQGRGDYAAVGTPGGSLQEIRGPVNWEGYESGHDTDFRILGSTSVVSPYGLFVRKRSTAFGFYFMVNAATAKRVITVPDASDEMMLVGTAPASGDVTNKILGAAVTIKCDETGAPTNGSVFVDRSNTARRLGFDLSGFTASDHSASWPNFSPGRVIERIAVVSRTGETASIGSTNLFAAVPVGVYRVSVYHVCTSAGTGGTLATTIGWNDGTAARTRDPAAAINLNATNFDEGSVVVRASAATNITYQTTVTGATGAPVYALYIRLEVIE